MTQTLLPEARNQFPYPSANRQGDLSPPNNQQPIELFLHCTLAPTNAILIQFPLCLSREKKRLLTLLKLLLRVYHLLVFLFFLLLWLIFGFRL